MRGSARRVNLLRITTSTPALAREPPAMRRPARSTWDQAVVTHLAYMSTRLMTTTTLGTFSAKTRQFAQDCTRVPLIPI